MDLSAVEELLRSVSIEPETPLYRTDEFRINCMKVVSCNKRFCHDWTTCPFAHPGEKARRRDPNKFGYTGIACPDIKKDGVCIRGDSCPYAHNVFEYWLHPTRYRTQLCNDGPNCRRRVCFFAHTLPELRHPPNKPYVAPDVLAALTAEAVGEAASEVQQGSWRTSSVPEIQTGTGISDISAKLASLRLAVSSGPHNTQNNQAVLNLISQLLEQVETNNKQQQVAAAAPAFRPPLYRSRSDPPLSTVRPVMNPQLRSESDIVRRNTTDFLASQQQSNPLHTAAGTGSFDAQQLKSIHTLMLRLQEKLSAGASSSSVASQQTSTEAQSRVDLRPGVSDTGAVNPLSATRSSFETLNPFGRQAELTDNLSLPHLSATAVSEALMAQQSAGKAIAMQRSASELPPSAGMSGLLRTGSDLPHSSGVGKMHRTASDVLSGMSEMLSPVDWNEFTQGLYKTSSEASTAYSRRSSDVSSLYSRRGSDVSGRAVTELPIHTAEAILKQLNSELNRSAGTSDLSPDAAIRQNWQESLFGFGRQNSQGLPVMSEAESSQPAGPATSPPGDEM